MDIVARIEDQEKNRRVLGLGNALARFRHCLL